MAISFHKATKAQSRARVALIGPAGSGKTYTALALATSLGQRVAVIDTERGSASKYADLFVFDVLELETFDPRTYIAAIDAAQAASYDVLIIDSLSHAWTGKGGVLDIKDAATRRSPSKDSFGAGWREASPLHNQLVDAMLQTRVHLIATMRAKTEYVVSKDAKGSTKIEKVGLAPVQRDGLEYEFDIVGDMDGENNLVVSKTRCPALSGAVVNRPDAKFAEVISAWLSDGVAPQDAPDRVGGDPQPPAHPAGSNASRMRQAQTEATEVRQRADAITIPTLEQIQELGNWIDAKAAIKQSPAGFQALIRRAIADVHAKDPYWFWDNDTGLEHWRSVLEYALELHEQQTHETSAVGGPPPAADPSAGAVQADGKAAHPAPADPNLPEGGETP